MNPSHLLRLGAVAAGIAVTVAVAGPAAAATGTAPLAPTITQDTAAPVVGQPATFTFANPADAPAGSPTPASFTYQLNSGPYTTVAATNGTATVVVTPYRYTNVLSVVAVGSDGGLSTTASVLFTAQWPPPAADQDFTGDGKPDLVTVGGTAGLPPGVWQAAGVGTRGRVSRPATNIGANGNGVGGNHSGADFTGAQIITGKFFGDSFEDVLAYYPDRGVGLIVSGNGHGNVLDPVTNGESSLLLPPDDNGNLPLRLANGYNAGGTGQSFPELLGVTGDQTDGYTLDYYAACCRAMWDSATPLTVSTPTGATDWQNWRISTKLLPTGTAVALWNPTTGGLYLWERLAIDPNTGTATYTQYTLAAHWQPAATPVSLQLTDFDNDGTPDLWAVSAAGDVTAYEICGLSTTSSAILKAQKSQHLT